mgnify:CR=1 FL=1
MIDLYKALRPILFLLEAEKAHTLALSALNLFPEFFKSHSDSDEGLDINLWGKTFTNPIGLAAGFDKNAQVVIPSFNLGFGFVEVGGVTLFPQDGNPKPRLFRLLDDRAIINRMGFNNIGAKEISSKLRNILSLGKPGPIGVNIGLNKDSNDFIDDFTKLFEIFNDLSDFIVINVSSPNTPGLRDLQQEDQLKKILGAFRNYSKNNNSTSAPILVKISPDLNINQIQGICNLSLDEGLDGLVISNTTEARDGLNSKKFMNEKGGLSGRPLFNKSTSLLGIAYQYTGGKIPLIGVGGISNGLDAYKKIKAGASLVQIYSSLIFNGPKVVRRIKEELRQYLILDGFKKLSEAIGRDHR